MDKSDINPPLSPHHNLAVFVCDTCSKSFSNLPSRNRHKLYCRKKVELGQPYRITPCVSCRQVKLKCNAVLPRCGRCAEKRLNCVYIRKLPKAQLGQVSRDESSTVCRLRAFDSGPISAREPRHFEICGAGKNQHSDKVRLNDADTNDQSLSTRIEPSLNQVLPPAWDSMSSNPSNPRITEFHTPNNGISLSNSSSNYINDAIALSLTPPSHGNIYETDFMFDSFSLDTDMLSLAPSLETWPSNTQEAFFDSPYIKLTYLTFLQYSTSSSSALARRESPFLQSSRNMKCQVGTGYILQNLRSYPTEILNPIHPPPYIHRTSLTESGLYSADPLAVCQHIVQMHAARTETTSSFLWRTVAGEQKRLAETYPEAGHSTILAMLQAMTTHILLRIFSEDTFSIDFDNDLVQTMTAIAVEFEKSGFLSNSEVLGEVPRWNEWTHMESKRRTVTVLFIMHLIFDINPNQRVKAFSGISQLPLPAYKVLWEAKTESDWTSKYQSWIRGREGRPSLTYGDMLYLSRNEQSVDSDPRLKDLNAWYVNMDTLGILVMMAATGVCL